MPGKSNAWRSSAVARGNRSGVVTYSPSGSLSGSEVELLQVLARVLGAWVVELVGVDSLSPVVCSPDDLKTSQMRALAHPTGTGE